MSDRFRSAAPYAVPALVGACLLALSKMPAAWQPGTRAPALVAAFALSLAVVAASSLVVSRGGMPLRRALHVALTPTVLVATAFGAFLVVERDLSRYAITAVTMVLIGAHFAFVSGMRGASSRYGAEDLGHISFALHVLASFYALVFAFGAVPILALPVPAVAAAVGLFTGLVAWETLWHEGFAIPRFLPVALAFGALGMEFYLALSFLPTSTLVDAAVALILLASALHSAVRVLKGAALLRRQAAFTLTLAVLVLCTARWA